MPRCPGILPFLRETEDGAGAGAAALLRLVGGGWRVLLRGACGIELPS